MGDTMIQLQGGQPRPVATSPRTFSQRVTAGYVPELAVFVALLARFLPQPFNAASYAILAAVALGSRRGTILALAGTWFLTNVNPAMAGPTALGTGAHYTVLAAAILVASLRAAAMPAGSSIRGSTVATAIVAAAIFAHSLAFSLYPLVSGFKAALWGVTSLAIVSTANGLDEQDDSKLHSFFLLFFAFVIVSAFLVYPLPQSRIVNGSLQGLLNQPQMYGVACALAGAYYFGTACSVQRPPWLMLGVVGASLVGVLASGARTGGIALMVACLATIIFGTLRSPTDFRRFLPGLWSPRFVGLVFVGLAAASVSSGAIQDIAGRFIGKQSQETEVAVAYESSRGYFIREMQSNIEQRPFQGVGLGIDSQVHLMDVRVEERTGIPISAAVEKGVMWIAIFEELGLILGTFVLAWVLWGLFRAGGAGAALCTASIAYFLTNFGEATFFSPSGFGMLGLTIFYLGMSGHAHEATG